MSTIKSIKKKLNQSPEAVFTFLSDLNNLGPLAPSMVRDWRSTTDTCAFNFSGIGDFSMRVINKVPHTRILIEHYGRNVFPYQIAVNIQNMGSFCYLQFVLDADMGFAMKMMASGPLKSFLDSLCESMAAL